MPPYSHKKISNKRTRSRKRCRRGTEVVELAIILPLLMLLALATLEICENIFLLQRIKIAASEGAVAAVHRSGTPEVVREAVQDYLDARGVDYGNDIVSAVTVTPDPSTVATLEPITVTVSVSTDANSRIGAHLYRYFGGATAEAEVTMLKETESE